MSATAHDDDQHGTYCTPDEVVEGKHIKTCMADLFSALLFDEIEKAITEPSRKQLKLTWNDIVESVKNNSE